MPPLHLGFLLDLSGSMENEIRTPAPPRSSSLAPWRTRWTSRSWTSTRRSARALQPDDFPRLIERIRMRSPKGWTAFYDALATYLHGTAGRPGRRSLVVYTDGARHAQHVEPGTRCWTCSRRRTSPCTPSGISKGTARRSALDQRQLLSRFADTTGGQAFLDRRCAHRRAGGSRFRAARRTSRVPRADRRAGDRRADFEPRRHPARGQVLLGVTGSGKTFTMAQASRG
jgi:hypothetical protein